MASMFWVPTNLTAEPKMPGYDYNASWFCTAGCPPGWPGCALLDLDPTNLWVVARALSRCGSLRPHKIGTHARRAVGPGAWRVARPRVQLPAPEQHLPGHVPRRCQLRRPHDGAARALVPRPRIPHDRRHVLPGVMVRPPGPDGRHQLPHDPARAARRGYGGRGRRRRGHHGQPHAVRRRQPGERFGRSCVCTMIAQRSHSHRTTNAQPSQHSAAARSSIRCRSVARCHAGTRVWSPSSTAVPLLRPAGQADWRSWAKLPWMPVRPSMRTARAPSFPAA
eukprot:6505266-Prymnesium_polylepis.1